MQMITHTGPCWSVDLPSDWTRREDRDDKTNYASADGSAGLYIAVWNTHITDRPVQAMLDEFLADTADGQDRVPGCTWSRQIVPLGEGDVLMEAKCAEWPHRILTRVIAVLPRVLQASFHDCAFTDLPESNGRLGPSLQTVWMTDSQAPSDE